ncbi:MAG: M28 family metallopeptidase [Planctomycetota bacterium]
MRRIRNLLLVLPLLLAAPASQAEEAASLRDRLEAHVRTLSGPEYRGRGVWAHREKAADYIAKAFEDAGLQKVPGVASFFLDRGDHPASRMRNVVAWLPGREPDETTDYVILSAHYDHLGVRVVEDEAGGEREVVYPGADDNASGVAALLEVAREFAATDWDEPPERAVLFVAFDLEENGLQGSTWFAEEPPLPLDRCAAFLTMDQMGRSLADLVPGTLFLMGSEHAPVLASSIEELGAPEGGTNAVLGIDFQPRTGYSDYVAFQERKIPFLFISSGACADYHQPEDVADKVDYEHLRRRTEWVGEFTAHLITHASRPVWREEFEPRLEEIVTVRDIVAAAETALPDMGLPEAMLKMVESYRKNLEEIIARGEVTTSERNSVRIAAQVLFVQAVGAAQRGR